MKKIPIWVIFLSLIFLSHFSISVEEDVKVSLLKFFEQLSGETRPTDPRFGWNSSSDPCAGNWTGVSCNAQLAVKRVALEGLGLGGTLNMDSICSVQSLVVLSIQNNSISGEIPGEISNCKRLTHIYFGGNRLSGILPESLPGLNNLKRLDVSNNNLSGELPNLPKISGLVTFLAQNNGFSGQIPEFDFSNFQEFNISFNNFSGPVPNLSGRFNETSLMGNSLLCGKPVGRACSPLSPLSPPSKDESNSKSKSGEKVLIFLGYILIAVIFISFFIFKLIFRKKKIDGRKSQLESTQTKTVKNVKKKPHSGSSTSPYKTSRSEYSIPSSNESASMISSSLVVLTNSLRKELRLEDLLKAPAELLGRGRNGSLFKVSFGDRSDLVVKRIKDWAISSEDFHRRMEKMDQVKHPNVLLPVAFYSSKQEKLVVFEYQKHGSLFKLLHGSPNRQTFDWDARLSIASTLASALAFVHKELHQDGISHGNLKSSNILMNNNMDPCISEYGLMAIDPQPFSSSPGYRQVDRSPSISHFGHGFSSDVYNFGVILLELLTGKLVENSGFDLAKWVHSVVREEWTVEVFDNALIAGGANQERMVNLLQVAVKCIDPNPMARPAMNKIADMINNIKDEEESSILSESSQ